MFRGLKNIWKNVTRQGSVKDIVEGQDQMTKLENFNYSGSHRQEKGAFQETQAEISELERVRMMRLDKHLGTNTHFHELESYEERLDSEHIMRRQILLNNELKKEQDYQFQRLFQIDPQDPPPMPKIQNRHEYFSKLNKNLFCFVPQKQASVVTVGDKTFIDDFKYLEDNELIDEFQFLSRKSGKISRTELFLQNEIHFSQLKFLKNQPLIEQFRDEYFERTQSFYQQPLYHRDYVYFSMDPGQGHPKHNIYRCKYENYNVTQSSKTAELIISQDMILKLLKDDSTIKYNLDAQNLIESLQDDERNQLYDNIVFSDSGNSICFTILLRKNVYLHLVYDLKEKRSKLIPQTSRSAIFLKNNLVFVRLGEFDQQKTIEEYDIIKDEFKILQQIDSNHQIELITQNDNKNSKFYVARSQLNTHYNQILTYENGQLKPLLEDAKTIHRIDTYNDELIYTKQQSTWIKPIQLFKYFGDQHEVIYQTPEDVVIEDFYLSKHAIILILSEKNRQYLRVINKFESYDIKINESFYQIIKEPYQVREKAEFIFQLNAPYHVQRQLKCNIQQKSLETVYQQQFSRFDQSLIKAEDLTVNGYPFFVFYNKEKIYKHSCLLIIMDNPKNSVFNTLTPEIVSLLDRGFVITLIDPSTIKQNHKILVDISEEVKRLNLSHQTAIYARTPSGCYISLQTVTKFPESFDITVLHNGHYEARDPTIEQLRTQPYRLTAQGENAPAIPTHKNLLITATKGRMVDSRKMVAQLRQNPANNETDIDKYAVHYLEYEPDYEPQEMIYDHLSFLLRAKYLISG